MTADSKFRVKGFYFIGLPIYRLFMNMIETHDLVKRYNKHNAVDKVSLAIEEGEIFGLLGPNGAGKTTTMMMLTTLREPTSGSAEVHALVDLSGRKNDLVKKYSGGMRRRLELARGLMHHPKILFLDEPTLGLDPQSRDHIWTYIEKLAKEEKITIIITTHYMEEADKLCDRIAIIDSGKIVVLNSPSNLKKTIGGDIVTLKTKDPNIEKLKKLRFVKKVEIKNHTITLTVTNASEHLPEILKNIGKVESVEVHSPTLDDVFIHYTGKEIREDSPEGGWAERA